MSDRSETVGRQLLVERCEELPDAELTYPFGPQTLVAKVGDKMFALFGGGPGWDGDPEVAPRLMSVKCDPELARALVDEHPAITPGYHLNKRHWISIRLDADLPPGLAEDLLDTSYDLVVDSLPRGRRPLGHSFRPAR